MSEAANDDFKGGLWSGGGTGDISGEDLSRIPDLTPQAIRLTFGGYLLAGGRSKFEPSAKVYVFPRLG